MKIIHFLTIDSTNKYLKLNYSKLDNFDIVYANNQSEGKGRLNHIWESDDKQNLLMSVLIKDEKIIEHGSLLTLLTGYCVYNYLKSINLKNIKIKWPNDIFINDKKICGILVESKSENDKIIAMIIGIGLNVNQTFKNSTLKATSIYQETNIRYEIIDVLNDIKKELINCFKDNKSLIKTLKIINENNYLLNKKCAIELNNKKEICIVKNINDDGSINVLIDNKEIKIISNELILI